MLGPRASQMYGILGCNCFFLVRVLDLKFLVLGVWGVWVRVQGSCSGFRVPM